MARRSYVTVRATRDSFYLFTKNKDVVSFFRSAKHFKVEKSGNKFIFSPCSRKESNVRVNAGRTSVKIYCDMPAGRYRVRFDFTRLYLVPMPSSVTISSIRPITVPGTVKNTEGKTYLVPGGVTKLGPGVLRLWPYNGEMIMRLDELKVSKVSRRIKLRKIRVSCDKQLCKKIISFKDEEVRRFGRLISQTRNGDVITLLFEKEKEVRYETIKEVKLYLEPGEYVVTVSTVLNAIFLRKI